MGTSYLQDGQYLLRRQKIKDNKEVKNETLEELYLQNPNKKFPLIPFAHYVYIYNAGLKRYDKDKVQGKIDKINKKYDDKISAKADKPKKQRNLNNTRNKKVDKKTRVLKEGNMLMRWGEPLSVYNKELSENTKEKMKLFLVTKGYFSSHVNKNVEYKNRMAYVNYYIDEGRPHTIDSISFTVADSVISGIIEKEKSNSLIHKDDNYDQSTLTAERERIDQLLKNHGYFDFSRQYILYEIDTTLTPYRTHVHLLITNPARRRYHKRFSIDSIIFVTDAKMATNHGPRQSLLYNGITYQYYKKKFSKKVLDQRVFLVKDNLYSLDATLNTQRQLAFLDNFKFININYDTTGGKFIANIFTSPLQKYQMTNEVGLNVTQGYPGPFYNLSLKQRNVFNGLENIELSGFFGFEGVASVTTKDVYSSTEAGGKLSLIFPQFIVPAPHDWKKRSGKYNPKTTLRAGFNYTNRPEYTRANSSGAWIYNWQYERKQFFNLTLMEISFIDSRITPDFQEILDNLDSLGNPLSKSFNPSFVSSTNFYFMHNFNPTDLYGNKSSLLKLYLETGGTMFNFFTPTLLENSNLEYFQFIKFSSDFRRHISLGENSGVATRFNFGIAYPYGKNKSLPYEKYFFAGGSNSIRAWPPRRLGPGSAPPQENSNPESEGLYDYSVEKPGEILLEANIEYRGKLIGFIDWAAFIDAGNVWRWYKQFDLDGNELREGSNFDFNRFYKEIAIGGGVGIRFNFSFLVIRFDYAIKLYDPARPEGSRWLLDSITWSSLSGEPGQAIWNIAIGYPF